MILFSKNFRKVRLVAKMQRKEYAKAKMEKFVKKRIIQRKNVNANQQNTVKKVVVEMKQKVGMNVILLMELTVMMEQEEMDKKEVAMAWAQEDFLDLVDKKEVA